MSRTSASVNDPEQIENALRKAATIAVVGLSDDPLRPSNSIARYLIGAGYHVVPVNPHFRELLDRPCYPDLKSVPPAVRLDIVDVFRRSEFVGPVADEACQRGVGFFWMQDGVSDASAAERLVAVGIPVAMDTCILRERERLVRSGRL